MSETDTLKVWMPLYIRDYLADTGHLSAAEHGAYLLLIMHAWETAAPLPDDDERLRRIARMDKAEWKQARPVLAAFFTVAGEVWTHSRVERERTDWSARKDRFRQRSQAAQAARQAKREESQKQGQKDASSIATSTANTLPEPCPSPSPSESSLRSDSFPPCGSPPSDQFQGGRIQSDQSQSEEHHAPSRSPYGPSSASAGNRGSRLAPDWRPDSDAARFAADQGFSPTETASIADQFRDYWIARPRQGGVKLDWAATWRNWLRREAERRTEGGGAGMPSRRRRGNSHVPTLDPHPGHHPGHHPDIDAAIDAAFGFGSWRVDPEGGLAGDPDQGLTLEGAASVHGSSGSGG